MTLKQLSIFLILFSATLYAQKPISLKDKALKEFENKKYRNSINLYTQLLRQDPNNLLYFQNRAFSFYELKQFSNAINDCNKALNLNPNLEDKHYILQIRAGSYYELEKWQNAFDDFDKCTDYYHRRNDLDLARSLMIYKLEKYNEAIKSYKSILYKLNKEEIIEAYEWIGFCYLKQDSLSKSKEYYKKIISLDTMPNSGLYLFSEINKIEGKYDEMIKYCTKILTNDSNDIDALLNRGVHYTYSEKFDLAIKDLKKFGLKTNNSSRGMYRLAKAYSGKKNYNKAINCYMSCLKDDPNSSRIHNQISWTFFLSNNFIDGLKYVNKAIALDEKNEDAYDTKGCIFYKLNKYNAAIEEFNKALRIDSLNSNSYYYRALCYIKTNEQVKACIDLSKVIHDKKYSTEEGEKSAEILIRENCNK